MAGSKQIKNKGKYLKILLMPINIKKSIKGILKSIKNKFNKKNQNTQLNESKIFSKLKKLPNT